MPPQTRVCVRCKSTKSKCVNFDPGQWPDGPIARKCDRCARLGFDCVPAPSAVPKPRAPRKAKTAAGGGLLLNVAPSPLATRALQQIPGTTTSSATETLSYVLSPGASPLAARYVLRAIATTARRRGTFELIEFVAALCRHHDIPLDDVLSECLSQTPSPVGCGDGLPPFFARKLAAEEGTYVNVRVRRDGSASFHANEAFERSFATTAEMYRAFDSSALEINSLFVHREARASPPAARTGRRNCAPLEVRLLWSGVVALYRRTCLSSGGSTASSSALASQTR
mmetsp:Transcript_2874/g.9026  ORF Transcript_2874/g.9026 Transcript_2874/m.9026 type:complete len:283 (+) Transcript_2874:32-880(+)